MKYLIAIIILLTTIQSYGQFSKGDKVLGGTFSISSLSAASDGNPDRKSSSLSLSPYFGVLVSKNLEIGGSIGYSSQYSEFKNYSNYVAESKSHNLSFGFYVQRYFPITDKFLFSITGIMYYAAGRNRSNTRNTNTDEVYEDETRQFETGLNIKPGFIFFPSQKWAFRANIGNIGYSYSKNKTDNDWQNSFGINYGSIGLGVAYYFRKEIQ